MVLKETIRDALRWLALLGWAFAVACVIGAALRVLRI
jgi:hypothetical protein